MPDDYPLRPPGEGTRERTDPPKTARGPRPGFALPGLAALLWLGGIVVILVVALVWAL